MNKKKWIRIASVYSMIYTAITLLNSDLYLCNGIYEDPSGNWHELDRAMILLIGIVAFELCTNLPVKPLVLKYVTAYIPSLLLTFAYVWSTGLRESLAKTGKESFRLTFEEIQDIAGIPIDHSFLKYKKELADYGYQVGKISMKEQTVIFNRMV